MIQVEISTCLHSSFLYIFVFQDNVIDILDDLMASMFACKYVFSIQINRLNAIV